MEGNYINRIGFHVYDACCARYVTITCQMLKHLRGFCLYNSVLKLKLAMATCKVCIILHLLSQPPGGRRLIPLLNR